MTQFVFGLLIGGTVGYFTACIAHIISHDDKED
jgi:hypothetical protein